MLTGTVVGLCLMNIWVTFHRSGIPQEIKGEVEAAEVRREKHPGIDDVYLVTIGDRTMHLDTSVALALLPGAKVAKRAWARDLRIVEPAPDQSLSGSIRLRPSSDFFRMVIVSALLLGVGLWNLKA